MLERAPVEGRAFLAAPRAGDNELRDELESLLAPDNAPVLIDYLMLEMAAGQIEQVGPFGSGIWPWEGW